MRTHALIGFVLAVAAATASAEQWSRIASWPNEEIFVEVPTIRRTGDVVNIWVRVVYPQPTPHGRFLLSSLDQRANIHCSTYRSSISSVIGYGTDGTVVERVQGGVSPQTDIPPESDFALVADRFCRR